MNKKSFLKKEPVSFYIGSPGNGREMLEKVTGIKQEDSKIVKCFKKLKYYLKTGYRIRIIDMSERQRIIRYE